MGTRVKMLNEYHMKALLERENVDFNKFYKEELIEFIEVAIKQMKELKQEMQQKDKELEARKQLINKQDKELWTLEHITKEIREYIEEKEKDDDNWIDYELCIEPIVIKKILDKEDKE